MTVSSQLFKKEKLFRSNFSFIKLDDLLKLTFETRHIRINPKKAWIILIYDKNYV